MPNAHYMGFKLIFEKPTGKILGAQAIGKGEADKKHAFITQEAYDALEEYDENTIYFILEPGGDDPTPPPVSGWVFDGYFPVILS